MGIAAVSEEAMDEGISKESQQSGKKKKKRLSPVG